MARADDFAEIRARTRGSRFVLVDRPTLLHGRAKQAGQCPCGCESWSGEAEEDWGSWLEETIPGPQLLIDRWTGKRWLRSRQSELDGTLATFDRIAAKAERVYVPRRCYREQLVALEARPKVLGIFGGARGGKTQALAEMAVDAWIEHGGKGVRLWWVAPELADTLRGLTKLALGEALSGRETRPALLPPILLRTYPGKRNPDAALEHVKRRQPIRLVDGTVIELRYAGRGGSLGDTTAGNQKGGNLKGDAPAWIGVDEGAEIHSSATWHTLIQRTTDSGGCLVTATTPKVGSPLKHMVHDEGVDLAAANDGAYQLTGYVHLSMLANPWITPRNASNTIETLRKEPNGEDLIKQDVEGQWLVPGGVMWQHFDEAAHVIEWHRRDLEGFKLDGRELRLITSEVVSSFFDRTTAPSLDRYGGQDFNGRGHCTAVLQWWCPVDLDPANHEYWVLFVEDIVVKAGEPGEAARFLAKQAGAKRNLAPNYFAGLAISCDSTGAQDRVRESATGNVHAMFTPHDEYVRQGFDMRPCHRSENGKPINPEKLAQQSLLHQLMRQADKGQDGHRYAAGEPGLPPSRRLLIRKASCPELIKGLREQARTDRGFLRKRSDTRDDRISDPVDALLYGIWPVLSAPIFYPGTVSVSFE